MVGALTEELGARGGFGLLVGVWGVEGLGYVDHGLERGMYRAVQIWSRGFRGSG